MAKTKTEKITSEYDGTIHGYTRKGGEWGAKQKEEYILDRDGNKIYDLKKRQYKCRSIPATDWNEQTKAEEWRDWMKSFRP